MMSCHVCGMWIEILIIFCQHIFAIVMPRMWHVD